MNTLFVGQNLISLELVNSTNTFLLELSNSEKLVEGTAVSAKHQSGGRGQRQNSWLSEPEKSLCVSVLFYPKIDLDHQFTFNKCIALALVSFFKGLGITSHIKWPNDIFVNDKKQIQELYNAHLYKKDSQLHFIKKGESFSAILKEVDDLGRLVLIEDGKESAYFMGELSFNFL